MNVAIANPLSLDRLAGMSVRELDACYRAGEVPEDLSELDAVSNARMLTVRGLLGRGLLQRAVKRLAASGAFPWRGKRFSSVDAGHGTGINRVKLAGTRTWFPFETRLDASAIDGLPCILLDYDKPENPLVIRHIRDELRRVGPGLYLGPAMANVGGQAHLALWFAVER